MEKFLSPGCSGRCATLYGWANERLGLDDVIALVQKKVVPQHKHSFWYYWGGIALFMFMVQAVSGTLLLIYYRPSSEAYDSVREITYDIDFGWLIRSAHAWAANLMILAVFIHMFSVFFMKAYRKPREFGWWSGLILLGCMLVFGFSGYLLPMDELAYFATKVGMAIPASTPIVGAWATGLIQGGPEVSDVTIARFFALHVVVLPFAFILVLAFHLWLVQKHGNAWPPSEEEKPESERHCIPFFPNFLAKDVAMWLIALNVLAILASMFPWQLGAQADSLAPAPAGIHPEWYFMSQFQALKLLGAWFPGNTWGTTGEILGIASFSTAGMLWALVPLYDKDSRTARRARNATWLGLAVLIGLIVLTVWGYADV
jgi:cytochrome b6